MSRPSLWARALLKVSVPRARYDDVVGDVEEAHGGARDVIATAGAFALCRARARWWAIARWMTLADVRLGLRLIRKQPVLSTTSVLALAATITVACMGYTFYVRHWPMSIQRSVCAK